jgi:hypothetical protein
MEYLHIIVFVILFYTLFRIYRRYTSPDIWDKSFLSGKVDTDVVIFSAYDKKFSEKDYVKENYKIINKYAKENKHEYLQIIDNENDISPYWLRVKILKELLKKTKEGTLIAYFDADAIPIHLEISIGSFVKSLNSPTFDIFISQDPQLEWDPSYPGIFNTGVFIVRNTSRTKEFVELWLSKYDNTKWSNTNSGWICRKNFIPCLYSGENYEQGAFSELYKKFGKNLIKPLNSKTLACDKVGDDCFALHLMGDNDKTRLEKFIQYKK